VCPFYFGDVSRPLFGCWHGASEPARDCAVALCNGVAHEHFQFQRAFKLLADRLAVAGFPVLRFDLTGCGDSAGAREDGRVGQWMADMTAVIEELRRRHGRGRRLCFVGARLAASVAVMAAAQRGDVDALVLWDPAVSGAAYLDETAALHRRVLRRAHTFERPSARRAAAEFLGFPYAGELLRELRQLEPASVTVKPASRILLVESREHPAQEQLARRLASLGAGVAHRRLPVPETWPAPGHSSKIPVPNEVLNTIVQWCREACP
jgi:pimeloyl-ACP methyl ester carboxylesterase